MSIPLSSHPEALRPASSFHQGKTDHSSERAPPTQRGSAGRCGAWPSNHRHEGSSEVLTVCWSDLGPY